MMFSSELVVQDGYYGFIVSVFQGFNDVRVFKRKAWVDGALLAQSVEFVCGHGENLLVGQEKKQRQGFPPTPPEKQRGQTVPIHLAKA
jgi:hypothetical protein